MSFTIEDKALIIIDHSVFLCTSHTQTLMLPN
jgi:hypothetical protein